MIYNSSTNNRRGIAALNHKTPANFFSGAIDEVRVYNRSLTTDGTGRSDVYIPTVTAESLTTNHTTPHLYGSIIATTPTNVTITIS